MQLTISCSWSRAGDACFQVILRRLRRLRTRSCRGRRRRFHPQVRSTSTGSPSARLRHSDTTLLLFQHMHTPCSHRGTSSPTLEANTTYKMSQATLRGVSVSFLLGQPHRGLRERSYPGERWGLNIRRRKMAADTTVWEVTFLGSSGKQDK